MSAYAVCRTSDMTEQPLTRQFLQSSAWFSACVTHFVVESFIESLKFVQSVWQIFLLWSSSGPSRRHICKSESLFPPWSLSLPCYLSFTFTKPVSPSRASGIYFYLAIAIRTLVQHLSSLYLYRQKKINS